MMSALHGSNSSRHCVTIKDDLQVLQTSGNAAYWDVPQLGAADWWEGMQLAVPAGPSVLQIGQLPAEDFKAGKD